MPISPMAEGQRANVQGENTNNNATNNISNNDNNKDNSRRPISSGSSSSSSLEPHSTDLSEPLSFRPEFEFEAGGMVTHSEGQVPRREQVSPAYSTTAFSSDGDDVGDDHTQSDVKPVANKKEHEEQFSPDVHKSTDTINFFPVTKTSPKMPATSSRQRTQSIEQFLLQSPSQALGRKRFGGEDVLGSGSGPGSSHTPEMPTLQEQEIVVPRTKSADSSDSGNGPVDVANKHMSAKPMVGFATSLAAPKPKSTRDNDAMQYIQVQSPGHTLNIGKQPKPSEHLDLNSNNTSTASSPPSVASYNPSNKIAAPTIRRQVSEGALMTHQPLLRSSSPQMPLQSSKSELITGVDTHGSMTKDDFSFPGLSSRGRAQDDLSLHYGSHATTSSHMASFGSPTHGMYGHENTGDGSIDDIGISFGKPLRSMTPDATHFSGSPMGVLKTPGDVAVAQPPRPQSVSQSFRTSNTSTSKNWESGSNVQAGLNSGGAQVGGQYQQQNGNEDVFAYNNQQQIGQGQINNNNVSASGLMHQAAPYVGQQQRGMYEDSQSFGRDNSAYSGGEYMGGSYQQQRGNGQHQQQQQQQQYDLYGNNTSGLGMGGGGGGHGGNQEMWLQQQQSQGMLGSDAALLQQQMLLHQQQQLAANMHGGGGGGMDSSFAQLAQQMQQLQVGGGGRPQAVDGLVRQQQQLMLAQQEQQQFYSRGQQMRNNQAALIQQQQMQLEQQYGRMNHNQNNNHDYQQQQHQHNMGYDNRGGGGGRMNNRRNGGRIDNYDDDYDNIQGGGGRNNGRGGGGGGGRYHSNSGDFNSYNNNGGGGGNRRQQRRQCGGGGNGGMYSRDDDSMGGGRGGGGRYQQEQGQQQGQQGVGQGPGAVIPADTPLEKCEGLMFQLSQEQNGCRYLQQKLDMDGASACTKMLTEVDGRLVQLMMDPFGNYLFQKLLEHAGREERDKMLHAVKANLVHAALNLHGTRSVQKLIEVCGKEVDHSAIQTMISSLSQYVTKLSMDTNGNHVIQRCLQYMPGTSAQFVYDTVERDVLVITRHRHGCCVFQRCIDAANEGQREALVQQVIKHAIQLMQDPFGNYVVQYILEAARTDETNALIKQLKGGLARLSMQKFSSNVVEKCLQAAPPDTLEPMISELADPSTMRNMLHDQYANYVVQCALLVSNDEQGMRLVASIRPHISDLSAINQSCARRVAGRVLKRFARLATDPVFCVFA